MRRYTVVLIPNPEDGGYTLTFPALPGLVTQGDSLEDALTMAKEAIVFHLECLVEEGEAIPEEGGIVVEHVEVGTT